MHYVISRTSISILKSFFVLVTGISSFRYSFLHAVFHDNYEFNMSNDSKSVDPQEYIEIALKCLNMKVRIS